MALTDNRAAAAGEFIGKDVFLPTLIGNIAFNYTSLESSQI